MLLGIDAGNTFVNSAIMEKGQVVTSASIRTSLALQGGCGRVFAGKIGREARHAEGVALASVVPLLTRTLRTIARELTGKAPLVVTSKVRLPFSLEIEKPAEVGADRLATAAGAVSRRRTSVIVIDVGSAITVDLILDGAFMGGIIMAGPDLSLLALDRYTAKLPKLRFSALEKGFSPACSNTRQAMVLGAGIGAAGAIKEAVRELEQRAARRLAKSITGGRAGLLQDRFPADWKHDPALIFKGLWALWKLNRPKS